MKTAILWILTPCSLVGGYQGFEETQCYDGAKDCSETLVASYQN
jgi:hypothetical protein